MVMKFNPKTNRFENPTPPAGVDAGAWTTELADAVIARSNELVKQGIPQAQADSQARREIMAQYGSTATTTPKETGRRTPTRPRGSQENQTPTNPNSPRAGGSPTTTVPKSPTTTTPKTGRGSGTTMAPPTTTVPKSPTTTVPQSPTTTVPKSPTTTVPATPNAGDKALITGLGEYLDSKGNPVYNNLGGSTGSGGSSGPSAGQKKASAKILTDAGKKAQSQYNAMAAKFMQDALLETGKYYTAQQSQANTSIDDATRDYLANLVKPTAYSNVPIAQMTPEQQGLQQNLQAYGATGQMAQGQQQQDAGFNQFMSKLLASSTQQLGQADAGYFDALRNAGVGGQMAARQGVANNIANLQGQSLANADAVRRQLIQAGIEALMSGQQNAATALAQ